MSQLLEKASKILLQKAPYALLEALRKYFRIEVIGLENVPRKGGAVLAPNHSGFAGLDAVLLSHIIHTDLKRISRMMAHKFWFLSALTKIPLAKFGMAEAKFENGVRFLKKSNLLVIFPEGEDGNFKPSRNMYELQEFKRGFVRMAIAAQKPIVPVLIMGAEESTINLSQLKLKNILPLSIPLPLNLIPLPIKWKIIFLKPIHLPYKAHQIKDSELMNEVASEIQDTMQSAINRELKKRDRKIF